VDSLVAELNTNFQSMVENFVFKKLIDDLRTFSTANYPEFCVDAAKLFKEQEKKFKGIIN